MANPLIGTDETWGAVRGKINGVANPGGYSSVRERPVALGWDQTNFPVNIALTVTPSGRMKADAGMHPEDFFPGWATWPAFYVAGTGSDSNDGLTEATAFQTLGKAITSSNTAGGDRRVMVKGGTTPYFRFQAGGATLPTTRVAFVAYGGRALIGTHDSLTWSADATCAWLTKATRSSVGSVLNLARVLANGLQEEFAKIATLPQLAGWARGWQTDGTTTEVNHPSGAATNTNTRVLLDVPNMRVQGTTQVSVLFTGAAAGDGFDFQGGSGALFAGFTGGAGGARVVIGARGCTFRYAGSLGTPSNSVGLEGVNGLCFFEDCDASGGATDCWNSHNVLGADMNVLLLNCTGFDAGRHAWVSCNVLTSHESVKMIVAGGEFQVARGRSLHCINTSKSWIVGATIGGSLGDIANGGAVGPCEVAASDSAEIWLDMCRLEPTTASQNAIVAEGSGKVHLRDMFPFIGSTVASGSGVIDTY